ncbi:MAG: YHYH protein, partial [Cyanobacteria bacterium J06598_3]
LSGGTETTCYRITVTSIPTDHKAGPWCPETITDSAEAGGIWPENGVINEVDGPFVENLDTFYNDDTWKLYEEDGTIRVTGSAEQCAAAARPDVDEAYNNYCVQCLPEYVQEGMTATYLIPVEPVKQTAPNQLTGGGIGIALNGVGFDPPAPTQAILSAHTLAPFDDCGGHINLNVGYHYHAHTGCTTEVTQLDEHAPLIGYMLDGFPLYARLDKNGEDTSSLDQCRGEYDEKRGYHYHAGEPGNNAIIDCFQGEQGCKLEGNGEGESCDATATNNRPPRGPGGAGNGGNGVPPSFDEAAAQLGVTVDELMAALGRPPFNLEAAATTLGVTVEDLSEALPARPPQPGQAPGQLPEQPPELD